MARQRQRFKVGCSGNLPVGQMKLVELNGREVKRGRTIIVHSDVIEISVYDKYTEDGDSISLYYGDSLIVQHFVLMNEDSTFTIRIDKEHPKQIILFAENLGTSPPNTAAMVLDDGRKETDVSLTSDLQSCDSFMLIYKEKD